MDYKIGDLVIVFQGKGTPRDVGTIHGFSSGGKFAFVKIKTGTHSSSFIINQHQTRDLELLKNKRLIKQLGKE